VVASLSRRETLQEWGVSGQREGTEKEGVPGRREGEGTAKRGSLSKKKKRSRRHERGDVQGVPTSQKSFDLAGGKIFLVLDRRRLPGGAGKI